ncbi:hypothetical protein CAEBREN_02666 [Caenorhabditis brenneri]|uniref:phenylalanine--tRNA ligase n=1 Tax=Caenorhabditis brenneri TaxID=135651 RepID=G0NFL2_CAEBE|nr:hypothetical protein CAEBREN_02666 [Caenorhabditis brenneri]
MPTVGIKKVILDKHFERVYTEKEFDELCFEYGLELDEITSEKAAVEKERGTDAVNADLNDQEVYKIDIPANQYDLLSVEGLSRAIRVFKQEIPSPHNKFASALKSGSVQILVKKETAQIRPFVVGAVLRDVTFDADSYASFIDLQDKLHQNICQKRTLVAIGTHDLDTIQGPFEYRAEAPKDIKFKPLNQTKEYMAEELMTLYSTDSHLKAYLPIIQSSPKHSEDPPVDDGHLAVPPRNTTPQSTRPSEVSDSNDENVQENLGAPAPQLNNEPAINRPHGNEDQRGKVEPHGENDQLERENNYNSVCLLSLSERTLDDNRLNHLLNTAPPNSVVILEDIDAAFVSREDPMSNHPAYQGLSRVTFSGLLNALDGVACAEERITFMTTNYVERLDPALIRPGRVDRKQYYGNATGEMLRKMFARFYREPTDSELAEQFVQRVTEHRTELSPATIQGHFLMHKQDPRGALDNIKNMFRD